MIVSREWVSVDWSFLFDMLVKLALVDEQPSERERPPHDAELKRITITLRRTLGIKLYLEGERERASQASMIINKT